MTVRPPIAPAVMLLLCMGFAALLIFEVDRPAKNPPVMAATAASTGEVLRAEPAFAAPPPQEFAEIAARPVFVASRRPPPPPAPPAAPAAVATAPPPAPPPVAASAIVVLGIVGEPAGRIAMIRPPNAPAVLNVREGDMVAGWRVVKILADRVVLRWNATEEEISFPKSGEKTAASAQLSKKPPPANGRRP